MTASDTKPLLQEEFGLGRGMKEDQWATTTSPLHCGAPLPLRDAGFIPICVDSH
jgi:hypothetical protein